MYTRHYLFVLSALAAAVAAPAVQAQEPPPVKIRTAHVADNVYVLAGAGGNIGLSVGDDGALLIDDGFTGLTDKITAAVGAVSKAPVRFVVNTHWHFDHAGGNESLAKTGATIVAHQDVRRRMAQGQFITVIDREMPPAPAAALPTVTFTESLTFHWNGDEVRILHVGPAHTDGDCMVYFVKANVLHVGDTWFNGMYPFIDVNAGGSLDGMVNALDRALALANNETRIIPGHGPLSDAAELRVYRGILATVRDRVRALVAQGKSRAEVIAAKPTKEFDDRWGRSWLDPDTWTGLVYDGMTRD
jgi:glyoxylase-like metal-dependent hydrolase (beta-lactamase superfamily II)